MFTDTNINMLIRLSASPAFTCNLLSYYFPHSWNFQAISGPLCGCVSRMPYQCLMGCYYYFVFADTSPYQWQCSWWSAQPAHAPQVLMAIMSHNLKPTGHYTPLPENMTIRWCSIPVVPRVHSCRADAQKVLVKWAHLCFWGHSRFCAVTVLCVLPLFHFHWRPPSAVSGGYSLSISSSQFSSDHSVQ